VQEPVPVQSVRVQREAKPVVVQRSSVAEVAEPVVERVPALEPESQSARSPYPP
jgi:hypothetical protein